MMAQQCTCSRAEATRTPSGSGCAQPGTTGLVTIETMPLICETPQTTFQSWLTPNALFYVRNHFDIPAIAASRWSLCIEGHVARPLELGYADLQRLPKQTMPVTLECAGNNRSDLSPRAPGNQFKNGAVSTAVWGGVPLKSVLDLAGVRAGAVDVLFEGVDTGKPEPGKIEMPYQRSLPIEMATHPDALLAYEMNGEPLAQEHGYPLRLIVPGWYGMASVKWLRRICVLDYGFKGFFQTERYIIEGNGGDVIPIREMLVKSVVSWPQQGDVLPPGTHWVAGLAWSGHAAIKRVMVSDDGGNAWKCAQLSGPSSRYAWQQWSFAWNPPGPGHYTLMARAEDEQGNVQPMESRWNRLGYAVNGVKPVCITVRA
jgi:sulfite oxidase